MNGVDPLGLIIALVTIVGAVGGFWWRISTAIRTSETIAVAKVEKLESEIRTFTANSHQEFLDLGRRVSGVREEFVRRADLSEYLQPVEARLSIIEAKMDRVQQENLHQQHETMEALKSLIDNLNTGQS